MRKLGSIQCLESEVIEPKMSQPGQSPVTFILFHGFGADAYDLQPLAEVFRLPFATQFLFPQGIIEVPIGPGWTGRAWWPIDMNRFQQASAKGEDLDLSDWQPENIENVRTKIFKMIQDLKTPWNQIILGGFSQGAMLATDICLHAPEAPKALFLMSGALIQKSNWKTALEANPKKGTPFFMSHGSHDMVLSHKGSARLETFLNQAGLSGRLVTFNGGHEIPPIVIEKANQFLSGLKV